MTWYFSVWCFDSAQRECGAFFLPELRLASSISFLVHPIYITRYYSRYCSSQIHKTHNFSCTLTDSLFSVEISRSPHWFVHIELGGQHQKGLWHWQPGWTWKNISGVWDLGAGWEENICTTLEWTRRKKSVKKQKINEVDKRPALQSKVLWQGSAANKHDGCQLLMSLYPCYRWNCSLLQMH